MKNENRSLRHILFDISVILKGLDGLIETLGGIALFLFANLTVWVSILALHELGEDPHDFIANKLIQVLPYFSVASQHFFAWYFLIHGLVKVILVAALLMKKLWAYPWSIIVLVVFIGYQLFRYFNTHSIWLLGLSVFDAIVVWLIWQEYQFLQKSLKLHNITEPEKPV